MTTVQQLSWVNVDGVDYASAPNGIFFKIGPAQMHSDGRLKFCLETFTSHGWKLVWDRDCEWRHSRSYDDEYTVYSVECYLPGMITRHDTVSVDYNTPCPPGLGLTPQEIAAVRSEVRLHADAIAAAGFTIADNRIPLVPAIPGLRS